jgi:hypothetical protein
LPGATLWLGEHFNRAANHTTVDARIAQIMAGASLSLLTSGDEQDPAAE